MTAPGLTTSQLEAIERDAYTDFWSAAPQDVSAEFGIGHCRLGDGVLLRASRLAGMVFNRLCGYGIDGTARSDDLDRAIDAFEKAGASGWVIQVAPPAEGLAALAARRGLAPNPRPWVKFRRGPAPASAASSLEIRAVTAADAAAFGRTLCAAFGLPAGLAPWVSALVERPRWRCLLAFDADTPVGTGALYLGEGAGWLGFGGTLPAHRGRGGQSALLAARIEAGRAEGCRAFVTETGVPLPGERAPSFHNITRAGFAPAYERPNLGRPG